MATAVTAVLVAVVLALPASALASSIQLFDPSVTPTTGTTATTFTFGITYANRQGSGGPNEVTVVIDGVAHAMVKGAGDDWKNGVRFTYSTTLPAGNHTIAFHSVGRDRFIDDLAAGSVSVAAAPVSPTPRPTPPPPGATPTSPAATPRPASTPPSTPGVTPTTTPSARPAVTPDATPGTTPGGVGGGTGGSGGSGGSGDSHFGSRGGPGPNGEPSWTRSSGDMHFGSRGGPGPNQEPSWTQSSPSGSTGGTTGGSGRPTGPAGAGWGDLTTLLHLLSWGGSATQSMPLLPSILFSAGTMALLMGFMFFGKRRRDGEPPEPDEVLAARAARGFGQAATATLVPPRVIPPGVPLDEIDMPRWRRPSLMEARKSDPLRDGSSVAAPLTFSRGAVAPVAGFERRLIRYHVVGLLDIPDEFSGEEIGVLAHDDEVQLLERSGTYWRVLCPNGQEGWIHKMTLGDTVGEPPAPTARQTWAPPAFHLEDVDTDILSAFIAARSARTA